MPSLSLAKLLVRIASVVTRLNIGGASPPVIALATGLEARGHDSLLVVGTPAASEGNMEAEAERAGAKLLRIPELQRQPHAFRDAIALVKLAKTFRMFRPDVVATHMSKAGALARVAARLTGVPVTVHTYHGKGFHVFRERWKENGALFLERALSHITTGSIVVSTKQWDEFVRLKLVAPERMAVIRYGLDLESLYQPSSETSLRTELGLPGNSCLVGVIARVVAIKGQDVFLRAAARLAKAYPKLHFVIVGDGDSRKEFEQLAFSLGLGGRAHFTGWRRDIPAVLENLDLVVLPTVRDFEGTPLAVIEALAAGRAVVATDVGGVAELVRHGETGLLVNAGDAEGLAEAIKKLLGDTALREKLQSKGRELVMRLYDRERMVNETEKYFLDLLDRSRPMVTRARHS